MLIGLIAPIIQGIASLVSASKAEKADSNPPTSSNQTSQSVTSQYDVHNMSLEDLKGMIMGLYESGQISEKDMIKLSSQRLSLEQTGGLPKDEKIDMVALFQQQSEKIKSSSLSHESGDYQRSLDILKGIGARSGTNIPQSV